MHVHDLRPDDAAPAAADIPTGLPHLVAAVPPEVRAALSHAVLGPLLREGAPRPPCC
ncbi:hypothetical protein AB0C59_19875 [Streptomyces sp. NPDC048664]|uniref:hypothetical protein n=1 Tax=Streptomyces sp. NPDC048664 TaxID=3154505 RepID=UPI00343E7682